MIGEPIGKGNTAQIFKWDTGVIFKLFDERWPEFLIDQEFYATRQMEKAGLPVPKAYTIQNQGGRMGILYEQIEGPSFTQLLVQSPSSVVQKAREFSSLHRRIHQVLHEQLSSVKQVLTRKLQLAEELSAEEKQRIRDYIETLPEGKHVCHMDFHPDNILYSPHGPIIIDWMTAAVGSPYADVARTSVILRYGSLPSGVPEQIRLGLETIRSQFEKEYIRSYFQDQVDQQGQVEQWYLPIMAARLCEGISEEEKNRLVRHIRQKLLSISNYRKN